MRISTLPSSSKMTRKSIPPQFAALLEFATAERAAWDYVLLPAEPSPKGDGGRAPRRSRLAAAQTRRR